MDKYLLLLLKEVNTIIIPGLGALTITNAKTGEIMFMPYLKYDDGNLANYIAERENWELNTAKNLIAKYVREVQAIIDRGESYEMYGFGTFFKDQSGECNFKNWDGNLPSERNEIPNVIEETVEEINIEYNKQQEDSFTEKEENENEITSDEIIFDVEQIERDKDLEEFNNNEETHYEIEENFVITVQEEIEEYNLEIESENIEQSKNDETKEESIIDPITESDSNFSIDKEENKAEFNKEDQTESAINENEQEEISLEFKERTKKKIKTMTIVGIAAGIGSLIVIYFLLFSSKEIETPTEPNKNELAQNNKNVQKTIKTEEMKESSTEIIEEVETTETPKIEEPKEIESKVEKEITKEINKEIPKVTHVEPLSNSLGNYYIIVGSFGVSENASAFANTLKNKGFNAQVLGKIDKMFIVSIGSYPTKKEAILANQKNEVKGWIYMKK